MNFNFNIIIFIYFPFLYLLTKTVSQNIQTIQVNTNQKFNLELENPYSFALKNFTLSFQELPISNYIHNLSEPNLFSQYRSQEGFKCDNYNEKDCPVPMMCELHNDILPAYQGYKYLNVDIDSIVALPQRGMYAGIDKNSHQLVVFKFQEGQINYYRNDRREYNGVDRVSNVSLQKIVKVINFAEREAVVVFAKLLNESGIAGFYYSYSYLESFTILNEMDFSSLKFIGGYNYDGFVVIFDDKVYYCSQSIIKCLKQQASYKTIFPCEQFEETSNFIVCKYNFTIYFFEKSNLVYEWANIMYFPYTISTNSSRDLIFWEIHELQPYYENILAFQIYEKISNTLYISRSIVDIESGIRGLKEINITFPNEDMIHQFSPLKPINETTFSFTIGDELYILTWGNSTNDYMIISFNLKEYVSHYSQGQTYYHLNFQDIIIPLNDGIVYYLGDFVHHYQFTCKCFREGLYTQVIKRQKYIETLDSYDIIDEVTFYYALNDKDNDKRVHKTLFWVLFGLCVVIVGLLVFIMVYILKTYCRRNDIKIKNIRIKNIVPVLESNEIKNELKSSREKTTSLNEDGFQINVI